MTYQQITLIGNVGNDPELKYTPSGVAVTDFSLACNDRWQDSDGNTQERTTWYRITAWRRQAETVAQYVKKGQQVMVVASRIEANAYEGKDGQPRASLDVTADRVVFLSNRSNVGEVGNGQAVGNIPF